MTWKIFEEANRRFKAMEGRLTEVAMADLERRGLDVRGKSLAEVKRQIADRMRRSATRKFSRERRE